MSWTIVWREMFCDAYQFSGNWELCNPPTSCIPLGSKSDDLIWSVKQRNPLEGGALYMTCFRDLYPCQTQVPRRPVRWLFFKGRLCCHQRPIVIGSERCKIDGRRRWKTSDDLNDLVRIETRFYVLRCIQRSEGPDALQNRGAELLYWTQTQQRYW